MPVIQRAQTLSLKETAAKLGDLTERARKNALKPADAGRHLHDLQSRRFRLADRGAYHHQPATIGDLGRRQARKRVVVRDIGGSDAIVVRPMAYVSLSIDHRVLDGHQTNAWLTRFVEVLETWPLED